jgi:hypothetical protein
LFVFGGLNKENKIINKCEYYDFLNKKIWIPVPPMPLARANGIICFYGNKIYIIGG